MSEPMSMEPAGRGDPPILAANRASIVRAVQIATRKVLVKMRYFRGYTVRDASRPEGGTVSYDVDYVAYSSLLGGRGGAQALIRRVSGSDEGAVIALASGVDITDHKLTSPRFRHATLDELASFLVELGSLEAQIGGPPQPPRLDLAWKGDRPARAVELAREIVENAGRDGVV